jgi:hypothetical protein
MFKEMHMSTLNQGNSQGGSQDNQQAAPAGGKQSSDQSVQTDVLNDDEAGVSDEELAFGEVRRADRVRQRQDGKREQSGR